MAKRKRYTFSFKPTVHSRFKQACESQNKIMSGEIEDFMESRADDLEKLLKKMERC